MQKVDHNLFVGKMEDCGQGPDFAVVHACKDPCHKQAVNYTGNLDSSDPYYLVYESTNSLFLNIVDMQRPLMHKFAGPIFAAALDFIGQHIKEQQVLIHCNQGISRAPAIALLYLAKRKKTIPVDSYQEAKAAFVRLYPNFLPSHGLESYLYSSWGMIY